MYGQPIWKHRFFHFRYMNLRVHRSLQKWSSTVLLTYGTVIVIRRPLRSGYSVRRFKTDGTSKIFVTTAKTEEISSDHCAIFLDCIPHNR